jgi:hypothetical protein
MFRQHVFPRYRKYLHSDWNPGLFFRILYLCCRNILAETNSYGLDAILITCVVSGIQKPFLSGLEPIIVSRNFDSSKTFSVFQNIRLSMPSLLQIGEFLLEL